MSLGPIISPAAILISLAAGFVALPCHADDPPPASDEVIVLPPFNIEGSRVLPAPEPWSYSRITDFEVLSSASDRETQHLLRDFETFRQALSIAWPFPSQPLSSSVLILCGRGNRFSRFIPPDGTRSGATTASLFVRDREQVAIVVDLLTSITVFDAGRIADTDGATIDFQVDVYRQLYREYVRFLLSRGQMRPPAWLAEGIAQIVMNMEFTKTWVTFGELDRVEGPIYQPRTGLNFLASRTAEEEDQPVVAATSPVRDGTFNVSLNRRALIPLSEMFAVTEDSPEVRNHLGNNRWVQQCYAFVHMCLYGERKRWQQPFADFLKRTSGGEPSEAVFEECFGMNYKQMLLHLRGYINYTYYEYERFKLTGGSKLESPPREIRAATDGEIGRITGDALRLTGHPAEARKAYQDAFLRGARDAALLAALGLEQSRAGNPDRAQAFLEAAYAAGDAGRPSAWYELARLRFNEARANPAGALGRLSSKQTIDVLGPLARARQHPPLLPEVFGLAATLWNLSEVQPTTEQLRGLDAGVVQFPGYSDMIFNVAHLNLEAGDVERAALVVRIGAENARDSKSKARFENLLARLPPQPAAAGAAAKAP